MCVNNTKKAFLSEPSITDIHIDPDLFFEKKVLFYIGMQEWSLAV